MVSESFGVLVWKSSHVRTPHCEGGTVSTHPHRPGREGAGQGLLGDQSSGRLVRLTKPGVQVERCRLQGSVGPFGPGGPCSAGASSARGTGLECESRFVHSLRFY